MVRNWPDFWIHKKQRFSEIFSDLLESISRTLQTGVGPLFGNGFVVLSEIRWHVFEHFDSGILLIQDSFMGGSNGLYNIEE